MNKHTTFAAPQLLVSVRSAREAAIAVEPGVDLIDVKEPRRGSLGPADVAVWREVYDVVAGRRPVSVALGELLGDDVAELARQAAGCRFAKIGLAGCSAVHDWRSRLERGAPISSATCSRWTSTKSPSDGSVGSHARTCKSWCPSAPRSRCSHGDQRKPTMSSTWIVSRGTV